MRRPARGDLALRLRADGYDAVARDREARGGATSYVSRLLGRRAVVLGDADGARCFYDESLVQRAGAVPPPLAWLLFGRGAVHGLDDDAHDRRKATLLGLLGPDRVPALVADVRRRLEARVASWPGTTTTVHHELVTTYGAAVLAWVGLDLDAGEARSLSRRLATIVDGFGFTDAYPAAWRQRLGADAWAAARVEEVRAGRSRPPVGSVLAGLADAADLDARTAGVELLNVVRPTIAVAWLGTFAALALDGAPEWRGRLVEDGAVRERYAFAQEVRRTTPFVPVLAGRARRAGSHAGIDIAAGDRLVLDVWGIDHRPDHYPSPHLFRPERFLDPDHAEPSAWSLVPQGGGSVRGHRCPGESVALSLVAETLRVLAGTPYDVVSRRSVDLTRMPTLPAEGLRVRAAADAGGAEHPLWRAAQGVRPGTTDA